MMRITSVVGARPQCIKLAAIARALEHRKALGLMKPDHLVIDTGQHYDYGMSQAFFDHLALPRPDVHLGVGSGSHGWQTGRMLEKIEAVLARGQHDLVLVYGDTNSTLAGALAAAKLHIPVAHIEAGMRSDKRDMPEELNRVLTDHVASLLFCPSHIAVENLRREGLTNIKNRGQLIETDAGGNPPTTTAAPFDPPVVLNVGDVMYDVLRMSLPTAERQSHVLECLGLQPEHYYLVTIHRAANTDDHERLRNICVALDELAMELPVVVPVHPRTRGALAKFEDHSGVGLSRLRLVDPVGYFDMLALAQHARAILTDSGGVQKEAYWLGVPCITLRDETEWVETVTVGANALAGADPGRILRAVSEQESKAQRPAAARPAVYGDGRAAERILRVVCDAS
jgi:UDP-GlcNAc3NAcA epimerase